MCAYDDVIKWKHFQRYWPFVRGIHRSPMNYKCKGQWRGALMFSVICAWINAWVNDGEAGDLRRYRAHYDVIVMQTIDRHAVNPSLGPVSDLSLNRVKIYWVRISCTRTVDYMSPLYDIHLLLSHTPLIAYVTSYKSFSLFCHPAKTIYFSLICYLYVSLQ